MAVRIEAYAMPDHIKPHPSGVVLAVGQNRLCRRRRPVSFRFRHGAKRVADRKAPYQLKANGRRDCARLRAGQVMQGRCRSARLETPARYRLFSRPLMPPASPAHSIREEQTIGRAGDETFPLQGGNAMPGLTFIRSCGIRRRHRPEFPAPGLRPFLADGGEAQAGAGGDLRRRRGPSDH